MFEVVIKDSAIQHVPRLESIVDKNGPNREFQSRQEAENFVRGLEVEESKLRLQAPAPQETENVDAYLVPDRQMNEWEPVESVKRGVTFPVGGNTYGNIGLGILFGGGKVSPPLRFYFSESAPTKHQGHVSEVELEPRLPGKLSSNVTWWPDMRIEVSTGRSDPNDVYYAEVKSGNSSFERSQRKDMQKVAEEYGVLRIRIDLEELPEQYTVRIDEVKPNEWPN